VSLSLTVSPSTHNGSETNTDDIASDEELMPRLRPTLSLVHEIRQIINLNHGFVSQLRLLHSTNFDLSHLGPEVLNQVLPPGIANAELCMKLFLPRLGL
jgi:hypothetical protein